MLVMMRSERTRYGTTSRPPVQRGDELSAIILGRDAESPE
jgi:hypothetical protein